jgi:polyhydroxyalkanoate synthase
MTSFTSAQQAWIDEGLTNLKRFARIPQLWSHAQRMKKGCTPHDVVYEEDRVKLLRYRNGEVKHATPMVFVFALVNRPYIVDLKPGKSVIAHFVRDGIDTYLVDWGYPTYADRHLTLDDHINGYLQNCIDYVCERTGQDQVTLIGYCMGGTIAAMYTALHPQRVRNLVLMTAGIDFAPQEGLINLWGSPDYFDVDKFIDAFGNMPAQYMQLAFQMLKPVQNLIEKPLNFIEKMDDEAFVDDYFAMEGWLNDNVDVPGEVYRQFVKYLYQQNRLVKGTMPVGKHTVNLKNITCPVLNLMARNDDLVPCGMSSPFNDLVGSTDRKAITFPTGHIGLAVSSRAQKELWPQVVEWVRQRSG